MTTDAAALPTDRFTPGALAVLSAARTEAARLGHDYLGQEHLLLALALDPTSTGGRALAGLGATADRVRGAVEQVVGRGRARGPGTLPVTRRAQRALELAVDEARRLNHHDVGTAHVLLGLLREGHGIATDLLTMLGVTADAAREAARGLLADRTDLDPWVRRYQLVLPADLFDAVQRIASREEATLLEILRRFIRLGLTVTELQETPGASLVVRDGAGERQLILV